VLSRVPKHAPIVLALMALFFAIGGPSFASDAAGQAARLITGKQVKDRSLTTKDVKDRSLLARDFKPGQLPVGAQGPKGDTGAKGDPCSAADPACRGPQGNNGLQGPGAKAIAWTANPPLYDQPLVTVGPWTITGSCDPQTGTQVYLNVSGPGTVDYHVIRSTAETGADDAYARSAAVGGSLADFYTQGPFGGFMRSSGTLILHSGNTVAEVELNVLADQRPEPDVCSVYGTAISAS
jgi:hypothetical protein